MENNKQSALTNTPRSSETVITPTPMGLFPTMESLQSVVDLAYSQMPITNSNQMLGLLMTYHNTLLKVKG